MRLAQACSPSWVEAEQEVTNDPVLEYLASWEFHQWVPQLRLLPGRVPVLSPMGVGGALGHHEVPDVAHLPPIHPFPSQSHLIHLRSYRKFNGNDPFTARGIVK